ncbi:Uncharacterised protein [Mycobacteroides abscessus subsp. abscessus]|nr:Uncharacterised protein [Mycobacteroides abscessus subsp. abscessus]
MLRSDSSAHSASRAPGSAKSTARTSTITPVFSLRALARSLRISPRRAVMIRLWPRAASSSASAAPIP